MFPTWPVLVRVWVGTGFSSAGFGGVKSRFLFFCFLKVSGCLSPSTGLKG